MFNLFNLKEFKTTDTEEKAIAKPANSGRKTIPHFAKSPAATGIPSKL